jgi:hypothetical protein
VTGRAVRDGSGSGLLPIDTETARDLDQSAFTPILRRLLRITPAVLGAAFVDYEGECIDYCSTVDPFETKVAGAHMQMVSADLAPRFVGLGWGAPQLLHLVADLRELLVARVSPEYTLVVVVAAGSVVRAVLDGVDRAVRELRVEAQLPAVYVGDQDPDALDVAVRAAKGWAYAPTSYVHHGARTEIAAVLGRWLEGGEVTGGDLVCFRVRTKKGEELTLAHDADMNRWSMR